MENLKIVFNEKFNDNDKSFIVNGIRFDVQVFIGNRLYNVCVATMTRVFQDFIRDDITNNFIHLNHPNLILVKNLSKDEITNTIKKLYKIKFFSNLGEVK